MLKDKCASALQEKLIRFSSQLSGPERDNLKLMLGLAAGNLADQWQIPDRHSDRMEFDTLLVCLEQLQPHSKKVPRNGIVYKGKPKFLSETLLGELQNEARIERLKAIDHNNHFLGCGGPTANQLAVSKQLLDFVISKAGSVGATSIASYLFYERTGQGLVPHVDTEVFSLNALMMIEHTGRGASQSQLVIFSSGLNREEIDLQPGELLLFFADSVVHGRTPVSEGELVTILTVGFQPEM